MVNNLITNRTEAVEQKYDWGAGVRGYEAANYPSKASACEGQKLGEASAALETGGGHHLPLSMMTR